MVSTLFRVWGVTVGGGGLPPAPHKDLILIESRPICIKQNETDDEDRHVLEWGCIRRIGRGQKKPLDRGAHARNSPAKRGLLGITDPGAKLKVNFMHLHLKSIYGRRAARAEDAQGTPTQSHIYHQVC